MPAEVCVDEKIASPSPHCKQQGCQAWVLAERNALLQPLVDVIIKARLLSHSCPPIQECGKCKADTEMERRLKEWQIQEK